ncbi:uncharacterized protein LOC121654248 [Melanotaenia boesemani]|uniref:uncharacterized protein LOC121654248 n=1 Tax=Melanotaenia boesemani TaxID=1250792 RepID=UPI001C0463ED|nr:uncharacterized protein LOC121654248 [Melanotaenia boesemani]
MDESASTSVTLTINPDKPGVVPSNNTGGSVDSLVDLGKRVLQQLQSRLERACEQQPLDLDHVDFLTTSTMTLITSLSPHVNFPQSVLDGLEELIALIQSEMDKRRPAGITNRISGEVGRPKLSISKDHLQDLMEMDLSVACISNILGVSVKTIHRRMREWGLSVKDTYSSLSDDELDSLVSTIKQESKNLGHRMVKGRLRALGYRVQWTRVWDSMHRVDSVGILDRTVNLGCVRRTHSVPGPLSLVHIHTNHKLNRYGIVMFGGVDAFSQKILYLKAANNNKASTALDFFLEAVKRYGCPSRVRGNRELENVDIARYMFDVRGCERGSFMFGKNVHNQRVEQLWRDVWGVVSNIYSDVLRGLEENRLLDTSNCINLFCAQYVFLPRIQRDLDACAEDWNNRLLQTEQNYTPNQLWETGRTGTPVSCPEKLDAGFVDADIADMEDAGVLIPELMSSLNRDELAMLSQLFDPMAPSSCFGADIYSYVVQYVENVESQHS